jgi:hypothetical protein
MAQGNGSGYDKETSAGLDQTYPNLDLTNPLAYTSLRIRISKILSLG